MLPGAQVEPEIVASRSAGHQRVTVAFVCAHFGSPQKITRGRGGLVTWLYESALFTFRGDRVVGGAWFNRSGPTSATLGSNAR